MTGIDYTAEIRAIQERVGPLPDPEPIDNAAIEAVEKGLVEFPDARTIMAEWAAATAQLPPLERELARSDKILALRSIYGSPARIVDAALAEAGVSPGSTADQTDAPGAPLRLEDPEPWPEPVEGTALLDEVASTFERFVALPEGASTALALWALHAHCYDAFSVSPRLAFCSPEKRCGKTVALTVTMSLVPRPLPASNITAAATFRAIEKYRPTLCIDEADTFLHDKDELRGVLNSGHTRASAYVVRTVGDDHDAVLFSTWSPVAIALIGRLPATLEDRAVVVQMRRRAPDEEVERLRLDRLDELEPLRRRMARWAADHIDALRTADPDVPDLGSDRAADNWRPLLAIADAVGHEWPALARRAAQGLLPDADSDDNAGVLLLADMNDLFAGRADGRLSSEEIVGALRAMEDRPWPEWRHGQPITVRQVARLLKPFNIRPVKYRVGTETARGYRLEDCSDAFARYLDRNSGTSLQKAAIDAEQGSGGCST